MYVCMYVTAAQAREIKQAAARAKAAIEKREKDERVCMGEEDERLIQTLSKPKPVAAKPNHVAGMYVCTFIHVHVYCLYVLHAYFYVCMYECMNEKLLLKQI